MGKVFKRLLVFLTVFLTCPAFAESSLIACDNPNAAGGCGFIPESDSDADCGPTPLTFEGQSPDNGTYYLTAEWDKDECPITLNSHTGDNEYGLTDSVPTMLYARYGDAVYLSEADRTASIDAMSTTANGLTTNPTGKTYTLTLDTNVTTAGIGGMKAAHTDSEVWATVGTKAASTTATMLFAGFYSAAQSSKTTTNGTQYIGTDGKITTDGITAGISISKVDGDCPSTVWHAQYTCQNADTYTPWMTGYKFVGWYDAADNGNRVTDFCLDSDKTVYAHWIPVVYSITYDCNGGTIAIPNSHPTRKTYGVAYDDLYTFRSQADLCTYQNQTPSGWNCSVAGTPWYTQQNWQIGNDVVCTAQWDATQYTITYDCGSLPNNGGTVDGGTFEYGTNNVDTVYNGNQYIVKSTASGCGTGTQLDGYRFAGWTCSPDLATGSSSATYSVNWPTSSTVSTTIDSIGLSGNATCEAQWAANDVSLIYLKEAGDANPYDTGTCVYGNSSFTLPSPQPTKPGYTFTGWKVTNHQYTSNVNW